VLESILTQIDAEIARLQQARTVLLTLDVPVRRKPGRPAKTVSVAAPGPAKAKRTMSAEARERIRLAQVKRWAVAKKSAVANGSQPVKRSKKAAKTTN
jgi:hypothetical protein